MREKHMNIVYLEGIKNTPKLLALAQRLEDDLMTLGGPSGTSASAEWDASGDKTRPIITLKFTQLPDEVITRLDPKELAELDRARARLIRLWGDLLQNRSHRQLQELQASEG
jgi:hypothetical protein